MSATGRRVTIVTGASSGIGRAAARRLAVDGANLVLLAAPEDAPALTDVADELESRTGVRTLALAEDVSDPATASRLVSAALEEFGRLDALVSNAGVAYFEDFLRLRSPILNIHFA